MRSTFGLVVRRIVAARRVRTTPAEPNVGVAVSLLPLSIDALEVHHSALVAAARAKWRQPVGPGLQFGKPSHIAFEYGLMREFRRCTSGRALLSNLALTLQPYKKTRKRATAEQCQILWTGGKRELPKRLRPRRRSRKRPRAFVPKTMPKHEHGRTPLRRG